MFYVNPGDPHLFVPKRIGIGWTLNFGHPRSWVLLAALLAIPAITVALGALMT